MDELLQQQKGKRGNRPKIREGHLTYGHIVPSGVWSKISHPDWVQKWVRRRISYSTIGNKTFSGFMGRIHDPRPRIQGRGELQPKTGPASCLTDVPPRRWAGRKLLLRKARRKRSSATTYARSLTVCAPYIFFRRKRAR